MTVQIFDGPAFLNKSARQPINAHGCETAAQNAEVVCGGDVP